MHGGDLEQLVQTWTSVCEFCRGRCAGGHRRPLVSRKVFAFGVAGSMRNTARHS